MADPLTVIGAASSCISVIELLGKSISTAHKFISQWKDADLGFYNLVTQLVSLKAALNKIKAWTESDVAASQHQLTMDLDSSIACCGVLVNKIDAFLSELAQKPDQALKVSAKGRFLLGNKSLNDTQQMLERQISALNLLLNACHLETASERKAFLEKSSTREAFEKIAKDSASLIVHRDASSFRSRYSDNWSKLSMKFTFDNELFGSKVYQQFVRGSLKAALRQQRSDEQPIPSWEAIRESEAIDRQLRIDRTFWQREVKVLILGLDDWERSMLGRNLHLASLFGTSSKLERFLYRETIFATFLEGFNAILIAMRERESDFENEFNASYADYIASNFKSGSSEQELSRIPHMYKSLSDDRAFRTIISTWDAHPLQDCFMYFVPHLERLTAAHYIPTDQDILHTLPTNDFLVTTVESGGLTYNFITAGIQKSERKKWIHLFDDIHCVLFPVPLSSYDQKSTHDSGDNQLHATLLFFESFVNLSRAASIILFTKVTEFRGKVESGNSPINKYFPDYTSGPTDIVAAEEFFENKFSSLVERYQRPHFLWVDLPDDQIMLKVASVTLDIVVERTIATGREEQRLKE